MSDHVVSLPLEGYALIGNMMSAALVGDNGSIDWLCLPRFDSDACFAALLGTRDNGRWLIAPENEVKQVRRRYRPGSAILETTFETETGMVTLIDFMPLSEDDDHVDVVRIVKGDSGQVKMRTELLLRFGYGRHIPWVQREDFGLRAIAGPDAVELFTQVSMAGEDFTSVGHFSVSQGDAVPFRLSYHRSHRPRGEHRDCQQLLQKTEDLWCGWSARCPRDEAISDRWHEAQVRGLITLKLLQYQPTGGIIAAPTTSVPEEIGGVRNWDYRFCWIRDATLTLLALLTSGYREEAMAWRDWLLRAEAGNPSDLNIMYGIAGERRLTEIELPWLKGYEDSRPVRIGNGAYTQLQIDVYGEIMDALHIGRKYDLQIYGDEWRMQKLLIEHLEQIWTEPDEGIWEVRSQRQHFTHSKLMAWVAVDRAIKDSQAFGLPGPVEHWKRLREDIRADICRNGFNESKNAFVQYYGGTTLDASVLMMAEVGFLPPSDPMFQGTVAAIERELLVDGFLLRYQAEGNVDGLPDSKAAFLACTFWLADTYQMMGRHDEAVEVFERLLALRNDVGLLAEQYDPVHKRLVGNFPQGFSHIAMVNTANNLISARGPAAQRAADGV
jgi:GH15 family glucan-1,4-alpha-glucosidase